MFQLNLKKKRIFNLLTIKNNFILPMSLLAFFGETQCLRHVKICSHTGVQNLYIFSPLTSCQYAPLHTSRWSRLFKLRSLLRAALTRTLTRIGKTRPKVWKLSFRFTFFHSNTHTIVSEVVI